MCMLFSEELYRFIDDVPVFQMSCGTEILGTLLGSKISTALPGCLEAPMVLFWFKAVQFFSNFFFLFFFLFFSCVMLTCF